MDDDLCTAWQNEAHPWGLEEIKDAASLMDRITAQKLAAERARHEVCMARAEQATLEQLLVELGMDETNAVAHMKHIASTKAVTIGKQSGHKRERYERGIQAVEARNATLLSFVDSPDPHEALNREINSAIRMAKQYVLPPGPGIDNAQKVAPGDVWILGVADMNVASDSTMLEAVKTTAVIFQNFDKGCLLIFSALPRSNQKQEVRFNTERKLEDKLMACGMNIENECSLQFKVVGAEHGSEKRPLNNRIRSGLRLPTRDDDDVNDDGGGSG